MFFDDQLEVFAEGRTPLCMRAELGTCLAPCCGRVSSEAYQQKVLTAQRFLEGRNRAPLTALESRLQDAVARLDFEYAARIRDRLERLQSFQEHLAAFRGRIESLTFLYRVPGFAGDSRLYLIRRGRLQREFPYPTTEGERQEIDDTVESVYRAPDQGPASLAPQDAAEILLVARRGRHPAIPPKSPHGGGFGERFSQGSGEGVIDHLQGLRVVDVSQNLAGPYCTQILADLGADVTKVEPPAGDAARAWAPPLWGGQSPLFLSVNRGKRSIQIDLKSEEGKDILWRLIKEADVF